MANPLGLCSAIKTQEIAFDITQVKNAYLENYRVKHSKIRIRFIHAKANFSSPTLESIVYWF